MQRYLLISRLEFITINWRSKLNQAATFPSDNYISALQSMQKFFTGLWIIWIQSLHLINFNAFQMNWKQMIHKWILQHIILGNSKFKKNMYVRALVLQYPNHAWCSFANFFGVVFLSRWTWVLLERKGFYFPLFLLSFLLPHFIPDSFLIFGRWGLMVFWLNLGRSP